MNPGQFDDTPTTGPAMEYGEGEYCLTNIVYTGGVH